jgi:hypothetical protein
MDPAAVITRVQELQQTLKEETDAFRRQAVRVCDRLEALNILVLTLEKQRVATATATAAGLETTAPMDQNDT